MSGLLLGLGSPSRIMGVVEIGPKRGGDQRRQGQALLDRVVLDPLDQAYRQVHVELLDLLIAHGANLSMLAI
jgi:hypothetical protein